MNPQPGMTPRFYDDGRKVVDGARIRSSKSRGQEEWLQSLILTPLDSSRYRRSGESVIRLLRDGNTAEAQA